MPIKRFVDLFCCFLCFAGLVVAEEKVGPPPPWRVPPYPIVSLPLTERPPVIDGRIGFDDEWRDAVVLTGCYQKDLDALAPPQAQMVFLLKLDRKCLYVAARSPIFPKGSRLRAFEKRPDHPPEIMAGDHFALEVLPLPAKDLEHLKASGHFGFLWNSLGTLSDQHYNSHPGQAGLEWDSAADLKNSVSAEAWETEISVPLERFRSATMAKHLSLPPKGGDSWGLRIARRFGEAGENLSTTWDNADLVIRNPDFQAVPAALSLMGRLKIADAGVAVQVKDLGDLVAGSVKTNIRLFNTDKARHSVTVAIHIQDSKGKELWSGTVTTAVGPGEAAACPVMAGNPAVEARGSLMFIRILEDDKTTLYVTPGLALVKFDDSTWNQYIRSLEVLRE
jgi:hypothetical protein